MGRGFIGRFGGAGCKIDECRKGAGIGFGSNKVNACLRRLGRRSDEVGGKGRPRPMVLVKMREVRVIDTWKGEGVGDWVDVGGGRGRERECRREVERERMSSSRARGGIFDG